MHVMIHVVQTLYFMVSPQFGSSGCDLLCLSPLQEKRVHRTMAGDFHLQLVTWEDTLGKDRGIYVYIQRESESERERERSRKKERQGERERRGGGERDIYIYVYI